MRQFVFTVLFLLIVLTCTLAYGQGVRVGPDGKVSKQILSIPFPFFSEHFGFAAGYVYGVVGEPQDQSVLLATIMAGTKGSVMGFLIGRDIQIPGIERLFFDPVFSVGYFDDNESYIDGDPGFPYERAGSNESDKDNYVKGDGWDNFFRFTFKYLLPIGHGRDEIISTYTIDQGLLQSGATGGTSWNPLVSGKSYLRLRPFYRSQSLDGDYVDEEIRTNGLDFSVFWDNRDFDSNPSKGFSLRGQVSRDFGCFDSSDSWTNIDGEFDLYIPLQLSDRFRKTVLALNYWTSYSPTWDEKPNGEVKNRPPAYTGSTLGGIWRMRAYPTQRFNDKAAVYYSAELRMIPKWNPFTGWTWLQKRVGIQWLQFVPFVEVGRVAPAWNLGTLHSDMKWDVGLGLRAWAKGIVIRVDTAASDEDAGVQMMVSQPFQF